MPMTPNDQEKPSPSFAPALSPMPAIQYAGFWIRAVASMVDELVLTIVSWILTWGLQAIAELVRPVTPFELQFLNLGIYLCMAFPYVVVLHYRYGATLGKQLCRIRVVDATTLGPLTVRQASRRWWATLPSALLLMGGYLMAAFHPRKQALHDLIARTVTIRK